MNTPRQQLIRQYRDLLEDVYGGCSDNPPLTQLPPELLLQSWWAAGLLPHEGATAHHGKVVILEHGRWNRCAGPDFTHTEIELEGRRLRGDIEIDPCAQDWAPWPRQQSCIQQCDTPRGAHPTTCRMVHA